MHKIQNIYHRRKERGVTIHVIKKIKSKIEGNIEQSLLFFVFRYFVCCWKAKQFNLHQISYRFPFLKNIGFSPLLYFRKYSFCFHVYGIISFNSYHDCFAAFEFFSFQKYVLRSFYVPKPQVSYFGHLEWWVIPSLETE